MAIDLGSTITSTLGIGGGGSGIVQIITIVLIIVVIFGIVAGFIWWIRRFYQYNIKIEVFKNIGGRPERINTTKGKFVTLTKGGDRILEILKPKKVLPFPHIQAGRNLYWFFIREDDEWINVGVQDLNLVTRELQFNFTDPAMRYARTSLESAIKERYSKQGFLEKYGAVLAFITTMFVIFIGLWLLMDKFLTLSGQLSQLIDHANTLIATAKGGGQVVAQAASGLTPAG